MSVQYPHCDSLVLHAPGDCQFCDKHPDWQLSRIKAGINFTGGKDPDKAPCPSEFYRPVETINKWPGNTPKPEGEPMTGYFSPD